MIKWLLRVLCYTHRSVPCSTIIKEASPSGMWEQKQRPIARPYAGVRGLGTLSPKGSVSIKSLPSECREPRGRGGRKSQGMEDTKKTRASKQTRANSRELTGTEAAAQARTELQLTL